MPNYVTMHSLEEGRNVPVHEILERDFDCLREATLSSRHTEPGFLLFVPPSLNHHLLD